jgi:transcriptional regulator with XRE-family HTH domain
LIFDNLLDADDYIVSNKNQPVQDTEHLPASYEYYETIVKYLNTRSYTNIRNTPMFNNVLFNSTNENDTKPNPVAKELGLSSGSVTSWKNGKVPHYSTLLKIADYFNVSVDYLLTGQKETPIAESDERKKELMKLFNLLDDAGQDALIAIAQQMRKQDK